MCTQLHELRPRNASELTNTQQHAKVTHQLVNTCVVHMHVKKQASRNSAYSSTAMGITSIFQQCKAISTRHFSLLSQSFIQQCKKKSEPI